MKTAKKKSIKKATTKLLFAGVLSFGIMGFHAAAFGQAPPPPPKSPPPPGEVLKKINPFKNKKARSSKGNSLKLPAPPALGKAPGTPPPPPANPLDAVKKIKLPKPPPRPGT